MSGKLLLKTMVLGTMTFSIYTIGIAAEVQNVNGLDSAQQTIASDTARKEAVRSSWMDGPYRCGSRRWYERFERDTYTEPCYWCIIE